MSTRHFLQKMRRLFGGITETDLDKKIPARMRESSVRAGVRSLCLPETVQVAVCIYCLYFISFTESEAGFRLITWL